jgi:sialidase-1
MNSILLSSFVLAALVSVLASPSAAEPGLYPEVNVFHFGEGGYWCIKIPYLFTTFNGSLLAFGEARRWDCSDFTSTDLVMKRSTDNGQTWSPLEVVYSNTTATQNVTIGNAAPLQLRANGRILLPFCKNNRLVFQTYSDDDGLTWAPPELVPGGIHPDWQWIGTGPPGGMQLMSGRLVVPSYHSYVNNTDGTITRSHLMINDDPLGSAAGWRIGGVAPGIFWTNECQAVELEPNHILVAARGFLWSRLQIESFDGGETLQEPYYIGIPEPLEGCEGSIVYLRNQSKLFYSGTTSIDPLRLNMTIWESSDFG